MLTIRFSRLGKKNKPFYRIIISEKHKSPKSKHLELLGHYNPHTKAASIKSERVQYWLDKGATVSNSVFNLLVKEGVIKSDSKRKSVFISKKRAGKMEEKKKESEKKAEDKPKDEEKKDNAAEPNKAEKPDKDAKVSGDDKNSEETEVKEDTEIEDK